MSNTVSEFIQNVSDFIEVKTERIKLRLISKIAIASSMALSISLFAIAIFFVLFFLSFGFAYLINESLGSSYLGFLILAGFHCIIIVLVFILFKRKIIQSFFESLLIKLMENEEDESED